MSGGSHRSGDRSVTRAPRIRAQASIRSPRRAVGGMLRVCPSIPSLTRAGPPPQARATRRNTEMTECVESSMRVL